METRGTLEANCSTCGQPAVVLYVRQPFGQPLFICLRCINKLHHDYHRCDEPNNPPR